MTEQKQSQFIEVDTLIDSDYVPVFGAGTNRKISKPNLFEQIKDETQIFIYPTIEQLQAADLVADPDWPIYVRVEETGYKLYKITSVAAADGDIALDNGTTATLQSESILDRNIASFADLATTPARLNQIVNIQGHTIAGVGGGQFIAVAGSVTNDGGTQINSATAGVYWKRVGYSVLDVAMFGCIGSGNEYVALQNAINAAVTLNIPLTGNGLFTTNSGLVANGKISLFTPADGIGQQFKLYTAASIELLKIKGDASSLTNIALEHNGSVGRIVKFENCAACHMKGCSITASHATNADPLVYTNGSNTYINGRNSFTNLRPNAFCIECDRTSWGIQINSQFDDNYMGGTGKGLLIWSSDGSLRPEGPTFSRNDLILTGSTHVEVQSCLNMCIYDNMLDQCSGVNIYLNPSSQNIEDVRIRGRYISSSVHTGVSGGVGIKLNPSAAGIASGIDIQGVTFDQLSYGIVLGPKAFGVAIHGDNTFNNVDQQLLSCDQCTDVRILNNKFNSPKNITLNDGASGGPFIVEHNWFASGASIATARTTASNFNFGTNTGLKTKGFATAQTPSLSSGTSAYLNVPHGAPTTPNINKCSATVYNVSGGLINVSVNIISVDATKFVVQFFYNIASAGVLQANVQFEI